MRGDGAVPFTLRRPSECLCGSHIRVCRGTERHGIWYGTGCLLISRLTHVARLTPFRHVTSRRTSCRTSYPHVMPSRHVGRHAVTSRHAHVTSRSNVMRQRSRAWLSHRVTPCLASHVRRPSSPSRHVVDNVTSRPPDHETPA